MYLQAPNTTVESSKKRTDKSCSWLKNSNGYSNTKVTERKTDTLNPLKGKGIDTRSVKKSVLKSNPDLLHEHLDSIIGNTNNEQIKSLLKSLDSDGKFTTTVDLNKTMKEKVIDKITTGINSPGVPLRTKSLFQKTLSIICDKNGLDLNLDLSFLLKGLNLSALMDLLNCLADSDTLAGKVSGMLDVDVSPIVKNKSLNTIMSSGKIDVKNGIGILGKDSTKNGIKSGGVNVKNFSIKTKVNHKRISNVDKKRYLVDLNSVAGDRMYGVNDAKSSTVGTITEDLVKDSAKSTGTGPLRDETKMYLKSRLIR